MRISDLQDKDVINIDGEKLGNIIDLEISYETGNIIKLIVYDKKGVFSKLNKEEILVKWNDIKKIGKDVILVDKNY